MDFTSDQIAAIIGAKELDNIKLRIQLSQALERIKELTPKADVVPIKGANDGTN